MQKSWPLKTKITSLREIKNLSGKRNCIYQWEDFIIIKMAILALKPTDSMQFQQEFQRLFKNGNWQADSKIYIEI